jgi:hypothetical protein
MTAPTAKLSPAMLDTHARPHVLRPSGAQHLTGNLNLPDWRGVARGAIHEPRRYLTDRAKVPREAGYSYDE